MHPIKAIWHRHRHPGESLRAFARRIQNTPPANDVERAIVTLVRTWTGRKHLTNGKED